ncbi:MAG: hypothetical protein A2X94_11770 [Bdellovibrionales bacterium GWB1_55_8]|nr:MAG: hypothetical protein A2X94_11770 [Bdellovibrionales bacterium GWB1_55_8]
MTLALLAGATGCGKEQTKSVSGKASIVLGASSGVTQTPGIARTNQLLTTDGTWRLSPNQAKITFTQIDFVASAGNSVSASLSDCTVTYDRSKSSNTNLLDCPFTLQLTSEDGGVSYKGSYIGIYVYYKRTIPILLDGTLSGIYSDASSPTKLSTGSAEGQFIDYEVGGGSGETLTAQIYFNAPFTISDNETPSIQIVTDMIHTILAQVSDGEASFQTNSGATPVELMAIPGFASGHSEFYSTSPTIESALQEGTDGQSYVYVRASYADGKPVSIKTNGYIPGCLDGVGVSQAFAVNPANAPVQDAAGNKAGGFLGLSSSGTLAWAFGSNFQWQDYAALFVMPRLTTVGQTAQMQCQATSSVPLPTDGATYGSGSPSLSATGSFQLKLLAI